MTSTPIADKLNGLSMTKARDRLAMADVLCEIATAAGATIERRDHAEPWPRGVKLDFTLDGAEAHLLLDGESSLDIPLISWCARGGPGRCFSADFIVDAGGDVCRSVPHHKETTVADSLPRVAYALERGLACIARGDAFEHYVHPWAAETAWIGAGSPEGDKAAWIAHYRATGERLYESPAVIAAREAYQAAGGDSNFAAANRAAQAAFAEAGQ